MDFNATISAPEAQLLMRKEYYRTFRIADMDSSDNPFPLIGLYDHEDLSRIPNRLNELIYRFASAKVNQHTGLSLVELMRLPRWEVETILSTCEKIAKIDSDKSESEITKVEQAIQAIGKT